MPTILPVPASGPVLVLVLGLVPGSGAGVGARAGSGPGPRPAPRQWNAMCALLSVVERVLCAIRKVSLWMARGRWSGGVCGDDLVCRCLGGGGLRYSLLRRDWASLHSAFPTPLSWGILPPAFPKRRIVLALRAVHSPLRCRGGPCATTEKIQEALLRPSCFFVHRHPLCKQACNGLPVYKKSPQALLESFFSVVVR